MRVPFGIWACLLVLACVAPVGAADNAEIAQNPPCQKPDESLLPQAGSRGAPDDQKIALYNQQVLRFKACTQATPDQGSAEIERIRTAAITAIRHISDTANAQIADIQAKIEIARTEATAAPPPSAQAVGAPFPAPECKQADRSLLAPARKNGKIIRSLDVISPEYEEQDRKYKVCVETYIQQGFGELRQIGSSADAEIKLIRDDANGRIERLKAPPLAPGVGKVNWSENGVESVTVEGQRLRRSQDTPKGEGDPDIIACRTPQQLADSRLPGPEICKRNRDWAALYKAGMDISSDGLSVVPGEKTRTINKAGLTCVHGTFGGLYEEHITNEICY
jgi:hypothetical protein